MLHESGMTNGRTFRLCEATGAISKSRTCGISSGPPTLMAYAVEPVGVAPVRQEPAEPKHGTQQPTTLVETSTEADDEPADDEEREEKRGGFIGMITRVIGKVLGNDDEIL